MVDDRLTDGRRIAELLASELDGLGDELAAVSVSDADRDAEATPDGAYAYRVTLHGGGADDTDGSIDRTDDTDGPADDVDHPPEARELAVVFVQPDRARVEFVAAQDVAAATGDAEGLRVRPKAVRPPRTLVFVEDGAAVKRAVAVFEAVVAAVGDAERRG
jgi:hypothetical protein